MIVFWCIEVFNVESKPSRSKLFFGFLRGLIFYVKIRVSLKHGSLHANNLFLRIFRIMNIVEF